VFLTLGFSACRLVAPVLFLPSASVQPASVFLVLFCPFDRRIGFGGRRFNRWVFGLVLLPLWTTAPAFKLDFAGSSGVKRRLNRRSSNHYVGSTGVCFSLLPALLIG